MALVTLANFEKVLCLNNLFDEIKQIIDNTVKNIFVTAVYSALLNILMINPIELYIFCVVQFMNNLLHYSNNEVWYPQGIFINQKLVRNPWGIVLFNTVNPQRIFILFHLNPQWIFFLFHLNPQGIFFLKFRYTPHDMALTGSWFIFWTHHFFLWFGKLSCYLVFVLINISYYFGLLTCMWENIYIYFNCINWSKNFVKKHKKNQNVDFTIYLIYNSSFLYIFYYK